MNIAPQSTPSKAVSVLNTVHAHIASHRRILRFALVVLLVVTAALIVGRSYAQGLQRIDALGQNYSAAKPVSANVSRLTFYRPANDGGAEAVGVYIDGAYHTSLVKNGYAEVCLKPGPINLGLRRVESAREVSNPINTFQVVLKNGQQQFLRVSDQTGAQPMMQAMLPAQVNAELAQARQQIHTLSRATTVVSCEEAPAVVAAPLPPQVISLASDALFPFGKSGLSDMLQNGRMALDDVISRVKTEYAKVDSIRVIGHSDSIGRPMDKQRISSQRAQTVHDYLSSNGLQSTQILSVGRADDELVADSCGNRPTPSSIACNAPNRRVAIEITGTRR
jgi:OOP family OmpA-OmpF porin